MVAVVVEYTVVGSVVIDIAFVVAEARFDIRDDIGTDSARALMPAHNPASEAYVDYVSYSVLVEDYISDFAGACPP